MVEVEVRTAKSSRITKSKPINAFIQLTSLHVVLIRPLKFHDSLDHSRLYFDNDSY